MEELDASDTGTLLKTMIQHHPDAVRGSCNNVCKIGKKCVLCRFTNNGNKSK